RYRARPRATRRWCSAGPAAGPGRRPPSARRRRESESPVSSRCLRPWPWLLDADGPHFFDVRDPGEALFHAVLLERAQAVVQALREHLGDARVLLDQLLQFVGGDQELVQAAAAFEARAAALVAADR